MNYRYCVYLVGFLDLLGVSMIIPLILTRVMNMGASPLLSGIIGSLYGGLQLISSPLLGNWSDISGRKYVLEICLLMTAVSYFLLGITSVMWLFIIARCLAGIFKHSQTLSRAYLADITSHSQKAHVFGTFNALSSLGFIVGPSVGGHLAELSDGFFWICLISSFLFLVNLAIVWIFVPSSKMKYRLKYEDPCLLFFSQDVWKNHWDLFIVRFFLSFSTLVYRNNLTVILMQSMDLSAKSIGYIISYQGVISGLSGFLTGPVAGFYVNSSTLLFHTGILQVLALVGLTFSSNVGLLLLFFVPLCFSNAIGRVCMTGMTVERCKQNELGTVVGMGQSVTSVARMLSPLVAGIVQEVSIYGPAVSGVFSAVIGTSIIFVENLSLRTKQLKQE